MSSVQGDPVWTKLNEEKTVLLTTYKRDGSGVDTPIHIAVDGGTAFIRTYAKAWKWKRLQRNPHVAVSLASTGKMPAFLALLAPNRSRRVGQPLRARVVVLDGEESARASRALARKYPFLQGFLIPWLHRTVYRTATKNIRLVPE
jgi:PPOX class probable F420-dependent enzyme